MLIRYALARIGFNVKLRAKIGDYTLELDPEVFARLVSRYSRGLIRSVKCVNGVLFVNDVVVGNISDVIYDRETFIKVLGWSYDDISNCWVKDGVKFRHMHETILEIFEFGEYDVLNVKDRTVVDVGAFVGDSSIYFALKGAKRVIAIEPYPGAFREMLENIRLNNLESVIIPVNAGLASKPGRICIENVDVERTSQTYHRVPAITLADVIDRYCISHDAVLKMDCEGCEYDVILNDYEHVRVFKELIFEYHEYIAKKPIKELLKILAKDYKCKFIRKEQNLGLVYCVKR